MENENKRSPSEDMSALRKLMQELPPAEDADQEKVLSALNELMASLDKLSNTVEAIQQEPDK